METSPSAAWNEVWAATCKAVEDKIVPSLVRTWILPAELTNTVESQNSAEIELTAPNDFTANWILDHYKATLESTLSQLSGKACVLKVLSRGDQVVDEAPLVVHRSPEAAPVLAYAEVSPETKAIAAGLDPRFTFDNFIVGASNQFGNASAFAVAERPGQQYNPLFLYSSPGLGKTHLLHAVGNYVLRKFPRYRVHYVSAENFVNELVDSLQRHKMPQFRAKYRESFDVLLIDDIQFIAAKKQTEEEFFHTFNALYGAKRQIVVTSDRPPKEIENLEERIRTRFEWGLVGDIAPPEIETRIAILKSKAEREDIYVPDDVATFIATHIRSNVRELEGILIRLQAQASLTGAEISLEMAREELKGQVPEEGHSVTVESIQAAVAEHFQVRVADLRSHIRSQPTALARQIAVYLVRKYTKLPLKEIGQHFGGKDHSTLNHALKKIERELESDPAIQASIQAIQNYL